MIEVQVAVHDRHDVALVDTGGRQGIAHRDDRGLEPLVDERVVAGDTGVEQDHAVALFDRDAPNRACAGGRSWVPSGRPNLPEIEHVDRHHDIKIAVAIDQLSTWSTIAVMGTERSPLFVRLSTPLLTELEARIEVDGRTKQAVVEDLLTQQLQAPPGESVDVVDLAAVAALLGVGERDVLDRIAVGDFPARRFGDQWRFSRAAVTAWLHGTDPVGDRRPGFNPS